MNPIVLFADKAHPSLREALLLKGYKCETYPADAAPEKMDWSRYTGLIIRSRFPVSAALLQKASHLQFIGRVGAGLENIDVPFAERQGIKVLNAPEGNRNAVAEHALGMLLILLNNIFIAQEQVRQGQWLREKNRGTELASLTVGVIGYGYMGSAFAEKIIPLAKRVIAYDKYKKNYAPAGVEELSLAEIQKQADVVSLHVPQTEETLGLVDDKYLSAFAKNIILINTARGASLQTEDLVRHLQSGHVKGACLDVLEYEKSSFQDLFRQQLPEAFEYLLHSPQVILTPHIAGWTHESEVKMAQTLIDKLQYNGF